MKDNFAHALGRVLVYEGGLSNNPKDPGGLTNKGITQGTYNSWRARKGLGQASVAHISDVDVADIYKSDYWDRVYGDMLPSGADFCVFDAAVNSGVGGAAKWAQAVVGLPVDGDFGPKTRDAIIADDPDSFIHEYCSHRLGSLQRLKTWSTFGKGWSARIANVQKTSVSWEQLVDAPDPVEVHTIGGNTKARTQDIPVSKGSVLVTHAGTLGGVVVTGAAQAGSSLSGIDTGLLPWIKYILAGLTLVGAVAGLIVYVSKAANDAAASATRKAVVDTDADAEVPSQPVAVAVADAAPAAANAEVTEKPK